MAGSSRKSIGRVVLGGAVVAVTVGIVVFAMNGGGDEGAAGFDYNCDLPGLGYPWLEHWDTIVETEAGEEVQIWTWEEPTGWAGYFDGPGGFRVSLPIPVDENGNPESMLDVYRMLCRVHPDLGGGGLRLLTAAELQPIADCLDGPDPSDWPLYTDGVARAPDEAHVCSEEVRVYGLPDLPAQLAEDLATTETTRAASTSIAPPGEKAWSISCTGYEVDEMDPRWRTTTGIRGAIRFDYRLEAAFSTSEDDGRTTFGGGAITAASISLSDLYGPPGTWELGSLNCIGCSAIGPGSPVDGTILPGNEILLGWGAFRPEVNVDARVIRSCTPMPGCAEWKSRFYRSDTFYHRLGSLGLILRDGFTATDEVTSPQGDTWVEISCTLRSR